MRAIRSQDTKPELIVRKALYAQGFRYRLNVKTIQGKPDIVLSKYKVLIFVHGCFWHGHQCHLFKVPKTRTKFWLTKIENNLKRDIISVKNLRAGGWRVAVVWECSLKGRLRLSIESVTDQLSEWISDPERQYIELTGNTSEGISDA